ncbi:hypothetical protein Cs308_0771 [Candidatus Chlamydia sanziniae]|uniref:Uncharacterized protein n=1 Tax=Candidatus Chlamydia sanziniae TaxID=1806891 RepID=A0A1A9HWX3_9CHLA|nr:hypothetical protein Cs308_0771 [Candidatus Chlamydia sanziniae]
MEETTILFKFLEKYFYMRLLDMIVALSKDKFFARTIV